jgi:hypothetical protein
VFGLAFFAVIVLMVGGLIVAGIARSGVLAAIIGLLLLLALGLLALLSDALAGFCAAAVHRYAAEGFFPARRVHTRLTRRAGRTPEPALIPLLAVPTIGCFAN